MDIQGSRTEQNILTAFAGESQARNKYDYFASQAKKEGLMQISSIFSETATQEREHAKRLFKFLKGGEARIEASFPAGVIADTFSNLKEAAGGENYEWTEMYPGFAEVAIAVAEKQHEKRYLDLARNLENGMVFKRGQVVVWRCLNCGYLHEGLEAPDICAACAHPKAYFELLGENW